LYDGPENYNLTINKNLTLIGQDQEVTSISGDNEANIFIINSQNVTIQELTLLNANVTSCAAATQGSLSEGAAIYNNWGTCNVYNCTITTNFGSAIFNWGTLNINGTTLDLNIAALGDEWGGAIFNVGNCTIDNSNLTNNFAVVGGAIANQALPNQEANLLITNSNLTGNSAFNGAYHVNGEGGAIFSSGNSNIQNCNISENGATNGGAISTRLTCNITNTVLNSNYATDNGGAISIFEFGELYAENCQLSENMGDYGGAVCNFGLKSNFTNTNLTDNVANQDGGAIYSVTKSSDKQYLGYTMCTLTGANVVDNNADNGGAVYTLGWLIMNNTNFTTNNAQSNGGSIFNQEGFCFITDGILSDNSASLDGGAIENEDYLYIENSSLTLNTGENGGAIDTSGLCSVTNSSFMSNTASSNGTGYGGAVSNTGLFTGSSDNNDVPNYFAYNDAVTDGGAISNNGEAIFYNNTLIFEDNTPDDTSGNPITYNGNPGAFFKLDNLSDNTPTTDLTLDWNTILSMKTKNLFSKHFFI
jgi:predicted outer membrane repeat protein